MMVTSSRPVHRRQRIGPFIRDMRIEQRLTLDDLAERAGVSPSHLSRIERGHTLPSFIVLAGIAAALGVSVDHFARLEQGVKERDRELRAVLRTHRWTDDEIRALMESAEQVKAALYRTLAAPSDETLGHLKGR